MEELKAQLSVEAKKRKLSSEYLCLLCQTQPSEALTLIPTDSSYEKLVECVTKRPLLGDEMCISIKRYFGDEFTINNLKRKCKMAQNLLPVNYP